MNRILRLFFQVDRRETSVLLLFCSVLFVFLSYLFFVRSGYSYVRAALVDIIGFVDIANRVHLGEVPYRDFHQVYGPAVVMVLGFGLNLGLNAGQIFGFQNTVFAAALLPCAALSLPRRFPAATALLVLVFVFLLLVVPMVDGRGPHNVTWAGFYNRQCWAALILTLLYYLDPVKIKRHDAWSDALAMTVLVAFQLYTKLSFGLVAVFFIFANIFSSSYSKRVSYISIPMIVVLACIIEGFRHFHYGYINDIIWAGTVWINAIFYEQDGSGILLMLRLVRDNLSYIGFSLAILFLYVTRYGYVRVLDVLYVCGVIVATILLRAVVGGQASSAWCGLSLVVVFLCIGELARRAALAENGPSTDVRLPVRYALCIVCTFITVIFMSGEVMGRVEVWHIFSVRSVPSASVQAGEGRLDSILVPEVGRDDPVLENQLLSVALYMRTIKDGTKLLLAQNQHGRSVLTFDLSNPFPYAANMLPPIPGYPFFWAFMGNEKKLPTPQQFVGDTDYVMVPRQPSRRDEFETLMRRYGAYLRQHYSVIAQSQYWTLWRRNSPARST